nr:MAG TPA: hypothetical protein [Caudoviricetes sp.]
MDCSEATEAYHIRFFYVESVLGKCYRVCSKFYLQSCLSVVRPGKRTTPKLIHALRRRPENLLP